MPPARFAVNDAFELSGRGVVLVGDVLSGVVKDGMRLRLTRDDGNAMDGRIRSVEFMTPARGQSLEHNRIGLILDEEDSERRALWKQLCSTKQVAEVYQAPSSPR